MSSYRFATTGRGSPIPGPSTYRLPHPRGWEGLAQRNLRPGVPKARFEPWPKTWTPARRVLCRLLTGRRPSTP